MDVNQKCRTIPVCEARNYGIDLLKTISMYMVVVTHILNLGGVLDASNTQEAQYWIAWFLRPACYCCVNSFAIATGYLMVDKKFKLIRLANLWTIVVFYLAIISLAGAVIIPGSIDLIKIISVLLPVTSHSYWYFTAYFILYVFGPFINNAIEHTEKRQYINILLMGFILFSVTHFINFVYSDPFIIGEGFSPWWIIYLYLIGAGIKKYHFFENISKRLCVYGYLGSVVLTWGSKFILHIITELNISVVSEICSKYDENRFISYLSPIMVLSAVFLTLLCIKINIPLFMKKILKKISPLLFQVYIIHMHFWIAENIISNKFSFVTNYSPVLMIAIILLICAGIYVCCICIDAVRYRIFDIMKIDKMINSLIKHVKKLLFC